MSDHSNDVTEYGYPPVDTQAFSSFDEFLAAYYPTKNHKVVKAVLALSRCTPEEVEQVMEQYRRLRHVALASEKEEGTPNNVTAREPRARGGDDK